jgi:hypothetical protein
MKKQLLSGIFTSTIVLSLVSCSKDDDNTVSAGGLAPSANTNKLCDKNWKISSVFVDGTDLTPVIPGCQIDDLYKFSTDGTLTYDEGPTKCNPSDPQTTPGTWSWASNESKLVIDGDTSDVVTNSGTVLKLSIDDGTSVTEITFGL